MNSLRSPLAILAGAACLWPTLGGLVGGQNPAGVETVKSLWSNGMVMDVREVETQEGKRVNHGRYYYFYENGALHDDLSYQHGDRSGPATYLHRNGEVAHKCRFVEDRREGWATWWDERGVLFHEAEFKADRFDGRSIYYYDDGRPTLVEHWKEGVKEGPWIWYHPNGVKGVEGAYAQDLQTGDWKYWNDRGEPTETRQYKEGELLNSPKLNPPDENAGPAGGEQLGPVEAIK